MSGKCEYGFGQIKGQSRPLMRSARSVPRHARSVARRPGWVCRLQQGEQPVRHVICGRPDVAREHLQHRLPRAVALVQRRAGAHGDDGLPERAVAAPVHRLRPTAVGRGPRVFHAGLRRVGQRRRVRVSSSRSVGVSREGQDGRPAPDMAVVTAFRRIRRHRSAGRPVLAPDAAHHSGRRDRVLPIDPVRPSGTSPAAGDVPGTGR
jgi:hypothetical protein